MNDAEEIIYLMDLLLKMSNEQFRKYCNELLQQTDNNEAISDLLTIVSNMRGVSNV